MPPECSGCAGRVRVRSARCRRVATVLLDRRGVAGDERAGGEQRAEPDLGRGQPDARRRRRRSPAWLGRRRESAAARSSCIGHQRADPGAQRRSARGRSAGARRPARRSSVRGDLVVAPALELALHDRLRAARSGSSPSAATRVAELPRGARPPRAAARRRRSSRRAARARRQSRRSLRRGVADDPEEPGARRLGPVAAAQRQIGLDHRVLDDVVGALGDEIRAANATRPERCGARAPRRPARCPRRRARRAARRAGCAAAAPARRGAARSRECGRGCAHHRSP